jgi:hypothetical protein
MKSISEALIVVFRIGTASQLGAKNSHSHLKA